MDRDTQFKAVIEANRDRIYRIACCYVRDDNDRQDICQEVTVRIWRSLATFQGRCGLTTWVYRVTVNTCLDHLRAEHRRRRIVQEDLSGLAVAAREPDSALEEDVRRLHDCIRRLPPLEKTLISLHLEDVSTRDMSEILGISEVNVRVKLHRTRQKLKRLWEQNENGLRRDQEPGPAGQGAARRSARPG